MKKVSFRLRNFDTEQFLTYNIDNDAELDEEVLDFIEEEDPKGIVSIIYEEEEEFDTFSYNVTDKIHLCELSNQEINAEMVLLVLRGLVIALMDMAEYRVPLAYLVLHRNYIYINSDYQVEFICIPLEEMQEEVDLNSFLRSFIASLRFDSSENGDYVAKVLSYINNPAVFNLRNLLTLVEDLMEERGIEIPEDSLNDIYVDYQEVEEELEEVNVDSLKEEVEEATATKEDIELRMESTIYESNDVAEESELEEELEEAKESELEEGLEEEEVDLEETESEEEIEESEVEKADLEKNLKESEAQVVESEEMEEESEIEEELLEEAKTAMVDVQSAKETSEETVKKPKLTIKEEKEPDKTEESVENEKKLTKMKLSMKEEAKPVESEMSVETDEDITAEAKIATEEADLLEEAEDGIAELEETNEAEENDNIIASLKKKVVSVMDSATSDNVKKENKKPTFKTRDTSVTGVVIQDELDEFLAEKELEEKRSKHEETHLKIKKNVKVNRASLVKGNQEESVDTETLVAETEVAEEVEVEEVEEATTGTSILSQAINVTSILKGPDVPKVNPYLIRVNTNERIMITKQNFKLGKAGIGVDYTIKGNGAVSRVHAIITSKDDVYYIKDNKSTNHTFVNGKVLGDGENEELIADCKIVLGDEEFVFKIG